MAILNETAEQYHARAALSASYVITSELECPAQAWWESPFNPDQSPQKRRRELDIGTALHLAALEYDHLAERTVVIEADSYRTKAAQEARDGAWFAGRIPLLTEDMRLVTRLHDALLAHPLAADIISHPEGDSELTYTWEWEGVPCKARVDRRVPLFLADLKTASSASPDAFQRAILRDGHHIRAAWYRDGWREATGEQMRYVFVVVSKREPHLVALYEIDAQSTEWGRRQYRRALREFRAGLEAGRWLGYAEGEDKINTINLPAWSEMRLADEEDAGNL
jgi:hypothetical protein